VASHSRCLCTHSELWSGIFDTLLNPSDTSDAGLRALLPPLQRQLEHFLSDKQRKLKMALLTLHSDLGQGSNGK